MSRDAIEPFAVASGWTAPPAEQREMSERVARRDGFDWRCGHCVETAQECMNDDRGCPYRQPKREQSNMNLQQAIDRRGKFNAWWGSKFKPQPDTARVPFPLAKEIAFQAYCRGAGVVGGSSKEDTMSAPNIET